MHGNSKFTPEIAQKILDGLKTRVPISYIVLSNGVSEVTYYSWINKGKEDLLNGIDSEYAQFLKSVKTAELELIKNHMDKIGAAEERWQAQAWLLERRWRRSFGVDAFEIETNRRIDELEAKMNGTPVIDED